MLVLVQPSSLEQETKGADTRLVNRPAAGSNYTDQGVHSPSLYSIRYPLRPILPTLAELTNADWQSVQRAVFVQTGRSNHNPTRASLPPPEVANRVSTGT